MDIKPGIHIKFPRDVGQVLVELLDYIELDLYQIEEETEEDLQEFLKARSYLLHGLKSYASEIKPKEFSSQALVSYLNETYKQSNDDQHYQCDMEQSKGYLSIGPHKFHLEHVDLMRTLMLQGCTIRELETDQMSKLIRQYIESQTAPEDDDVNLSDIEDEEVDKYIKSDYEVAQGKFCWLLSNNYSEISK